MKGVGDEVTLPKFAPVTEAPPSSLQKGMDCVFTQNLSQTLSWVEECSSQETDSNKKAGRPNKRRQRESEAELNKTLGNQTVISEILKGKKSNKEGKDNGRSPSTHKL